MRDAGIHSLCGPRFDQVRAWIYGIITALVPILTIYGIVDQTTAPLWISLAASVLGTATALAHTPRGEQ